MTKEDIGITLKQLRLACGMTQKEVAEKIGRKQQIVGHWETGYAQPDANTLFTLCEIYGTTVDEAFGFVRKNIDISPSDYELIKKFHALDDHGRESVNIILDREIQRVKSLANMQKQLSTQSTYVIELEKATRPHYTISYYQKLASAGSGEYLFDNVPTDTIDVPVTALSEQADFAIGVNGNSMEPTYYDGDKVYVRLTEEIPTGHIGVFTRGNECFIKELGNDRLISHNHAGGYKDIPASEEIKLVGEVLGKVEEI